MFAKDKVRKHGNGSHRDFVSNLVVTIGYHLYAVTGGWQGYAFHSTSKHSGK